MTKKNVNYLTTILLSTVILFSLINVHQLPTIASTLAEWKLINEGLTHPNVNCLAIDPKNTKTIYVGTVDGGIFKSTMGGLRWFAINTGLTGTDVRSIVIDPKNTTTLYIVVYGAGVFKTTNGGNSWFSVSSGITPNYCLHPLVIDPSNTQTLYVGHYT